MAIWFHWIKVKTVCYATEDDARLKGVMEALTGEEELEVSVSEGIHGNPIIVIDSQLTHSKQFERLFSNLGKEIVQKIAEELDSRIDEDCALYFRLDKQKAVQGVYEITHGGDVISITCKIASHPAKKESAVKTAEEYFTGLLQKL